MEGKQIGDALTPEEARVQSQKYRQDMSALFADADLGRRVREMLASPHASTEFILAGTDGGPAAAWDWLRCELLGEEPTPGQYLDAFKAGIDAGPLGSPEYREAASGSLATGGAAGEADPPSAQVLDLMQALKDSLKRKESRDAVEAWNAAYPPGTRVLITQGNGSTFPTKTRTAAWLGNGGVPVVDVEVPGGRFPLSSCFNLSLCTPLVRKEGA